MTTDKSLNDLIKQRSAELKKNPAYDPRREQELDDLYNQYVPPHSREETTHLLDIAERDAYIDPFPPIGSQKMAGAAIKKGIRVAVGWYIQYIAQQMSTFGSGVSQALRSLHSDVESLKKRIDISGIDEYMNSLKLSELSDQQWKQVAGLGPHKGTLLVSSASASELFSETGCERVIAIDVNREAVARVEPPVDVRCDNFVSHIQTFEANSVEGVILHGRIAVDSVSERIAAIKESARVLKGMAPLVLVFPTKSTSDIGVATELTSAPLWSSTTWNHIVSSHFDQVKIDDTLGDSYAVIVASNDACVG